LKKAVVYGAGNIGRGFMGHLFNLSGYEVVFIDINTTLIDRLNANHRYFVRLVSNKGFREELIENVRGVNAAETDRVASEIASANIMAVAVGANVLPSIVNIIVAGLEKRWHNNNFVPLNIVICENLPNAGSILHELIERVLTKDFHKYLNTSIGLVEASIGRMVPDIQREMEQDDPLRVCVEEYSELPVDKEAFKGAIPAVAGMKPFSPFSYYIQRKLFMHNMAHSLIAYLGFYEKKKYLCDACEEPGVKLIALQALFESSIALSEENNLPVKVLYEHAGDLLFRFGNRALGDTVERVGRDPVRKLSHGDRLTGAGLLCEKHNIAPVYISIGIAAGFLFSAPDDHMAYKMRDRVSEIGIGNAIKEFCNIGPSDLMFELIIRFYEMLKQGADLKEIIGTAEIENHKTLLQ
jgi:mannitol-1-phosphate 5-dehydrogenase